MPDPLFHPITFGMWPVSLKQARERRKGQSERINEAKQNYMSTKTKDQVLEKWNAPQPVDNVSMVWGGEMKRLLPAWDDIPAQFRKHEGTPWNHIQARWFFMGLPKDTKFIPKPGIDKNTALAHLQAIQRSWDPKHEHKEAAVAWLMSLWFERVDIPESAK